MCARLVTRRRVNERKRSGGIRIPRCGSGAARPALNMQQIRNRPPPARKWARPGPGSDRGRRSPNQPMRNERPRPPSPRLRCAPGHPHRPCACARRPRGRRETSELMSESRGAARSGTHTTHEHEARNEHDTDCGDPRRVHGDHGPVKAQGSRAPVSGWT